MKRPCVEHVRQTDATRRRMAARATLSARARAVITSELAAVPYRNRADMAEALIVAATWALGTARDAVGAATFLSAHSGRVVSPLPSGGARSAAEAVFAGARR